jgi:hypothetical protein
VWVYDGVKETDLCDEIFINSEWTSIKSKLRH